jgi:WD40 repeat protein
MNSLAAPSASEDAPMTQATQALESLALQNREDAAILVQSNTFAPQTAYSTPQVAWRPDGSGVWVNGDDGVVRGIEAKTGKVIATLKNGHEPGCKVRTIWTGYVDVQGEGDNTAREEWVISGGFDKRLVLWKV